MLIPSSLSFHEIWLQPVLLPNQSQRVWWPSAAPSPSDMHAVLCMEKIGQSEMPRSRLCLNGKGARYAGCRAFALDTRCKMRWESPALSDETAIAFKNACKTFGFGPEQVLTCPTDQQVQVYMHTRLNCSYTTLLF